VVLAATLSAIPVIPAIGLVLVLSVDWFVGIARALGNLIGNCVATVVIAVWEGDIDRARANRVLNGDLRDDESSGVGAAQVAPATDLLYGDRKSQRLGNRFPGRRSSKTFLFRGCRGRRESRLPN
jgi:hypothetical protein